MMASIEKRRGEVDTLMAIVSMLRDNPLQLSVLPLSLSFTIGLCSVATAQESFDDKVLPKSSKVTIADSNGNPIFTVPSRIYMEYGTSSIESKSNPVGVVDIDSHRFKIGADFITASPWLWGFALGYTKTHDDGLGFPPFGPATVDTEKNIKSASIYLGRQLAPRLFGGVEFAYNIADGTTIYNSAFRVTEKSNTYSVSPLINYTLFASDEWHAKIGGSIRFGSAEYDYVANVPPSASASNISAHVPLSLTRKINPNFDLTVSATLNQILSQDTFANVPVPDQTTVTLGAGASYKLANGVSIYARASFNVFDDAYESVRGTVGISIPLIGDLSNYQPE